MFRVSFVDSQSFCYFRTRFELRVDKLHSRKGGRRRRSRIPIDRKKQPKIAAALSGTARAPLSAVDQRGGCTDVPGMSRGRGGRGAWFVIKSCFTTAEQAVIVI